MQSTCICGATWWRGGPDALRGDVGSAGGLQAAPHSDRRRLGACDGNLSELCGAKRPDGPDRLLRTTLPLAAADVLALLLTGDSAARGGLLFLRLCGVEGGASVCEDSPDCLETGALLCRTAAGSETTAAVTS